MTGCSPKPTPYFVKTKDFRIVVFPYSVDENPGSPEPRCSIYGMDTWTGRIKVPCMFAEQVAGLISDLDAERARYKKNIEVNAKALNAD